MPLRLGRVLLAAFVALSLFVLLNGTLAVSATASPATSPARPPAHLPALAAADTFSATAVLTFSTDSVTMGDAFTVTAGLVTTGTCRFALYDVTLRQSDPLFAYVDPPGSVIGPPGENPAIWRLGAAKTGVTTFTVEFYGETNCDGVWQWTTVRSGSQPVPVTPAPTRIVLPFVGRNTPPVPVTALGSLGGGYSIASAINDRGQVAGNSRTASGQEHAVLWETGE